MFNEVTDCTYLGTALHSCGQPTLAGKHYCAEHYYIIYQEGTALYKRKKDLKTANSVWDLESEFNQAVEELVAEGYDFDLPRWEVETVEEA